MQSIIFSKSFPSIIIPPLVPIKKIATFITGFIGSAEHVKIIANFVRIIKTLKPEMRYFCDPVMRDVNKGRMFRNRQTVLKTINYNSSSEIKPFDIR